MATLRRLAVHGFGTSQPCRHVLGRYHKMFGLSDLKCAADQITYILQSNSPQGQESTPIHGALRLQARALLAQQREAQVTKEEGTLVQYEKQSILSNMDVNKAFASLQSHNARFESLLRSALEIDSYFHCLSARYDLLS